MNATWIDELQMQVRNLKERVAILEAPRFTVECVAPWDGGYSVKNAQTEKEIGFFFIADEVRVVEPIWDVRKSTDQRGDIIWAASKIVTAFDIVIVGEDEDDDD